MDKWNKPSELTKSIKWIQLIAAHSSLSLLYKIQLHIENMMCWIHMYASFECFFFFCMEVRVSIQSDLMEPSLLGLWAALFDCCRTLFTLAVLFLRLCPQAWCPGHGLFILVGIGEALLTAPKLKTKAPMSQGGRRSDSSCRVEYTDESRKLNNKQRGRLMSILMSTDTISKRQILNLASTLRRWAEV